MFDILDKIAKNIGIMNERIGGLNSLLILPLMGVVIYEVICRYILNAPTSWGFEMTVFIYGVHYMLGLAMTEGRGGHVKVDVFVSRMSPKWRAAFGIVTSAVIFLPTFFFMMLYSIHFAINSTAMQELNSTSWAPPIWPLKILMAVGFAMLFLQGLETLLRHIETFRGFEEN